MVVVRVPAHLLDGVSRRVLQDHVGDIAIEGVALDDLIGLAGSRRQGWSEEGHESSGGEPGGMEGPEPPHGPNSCLTADPPPPPVEGALPPLDVAAAEATPYSCSWGGVLGAIGDGVVVVAGAGVVVTVGGGVATVVVVVVGVGGESGFGCGRWESTSWYGAPNRAVCTCAGCPMCLGLPTAVAGFLPSTPPRSGIRVGTTPVARQAVAATPPPRHIAVSFPAVPAPASFASTPVPAAPAPRALPETLIVCVEVSCTPSPALRPKALRADSFARRTRSDP
jgi:hypothetical protein